MPLLPPAPAACVPEQHVLSSSILPLLQTARTIPSLFWTLRLIWFVLWGLVLLTAISWWWVSPGGFPPVHIRFWSNAIIPVGVAGLSVLGLLSVTKFLPWLLSPLSLFFGAALGSGSLVAAILFPDSIGWLALVSAAMAISLGTLSGLTWKASKGSPRLAILVVMGSSLLGSFAALDQRAAAPCTVPLDLPFPDPPVPRGELASMTSLADGVKINPADANLLLTYGDLELDIQPLMTFGGRSPDRCWPRLSSNPLHFHSQRKLKAWRLGLGLQHTRIWYEDEGDSDGESLLQVLPREGTVEIEAYSRIRKPIYTLTNFWCGYVVRGHRELFFTFSPCPNVPIAVTPYSGPTNAPIRAAFLDHQNVFRVVEASEGDRGPFKELAVGRLAPNDSFAITLSDGPRAVCRMVFDDWAAQASRALSPTAGWGLPENVIIFDRYGNAPSSMAAVWISLANTFVGAGWDSVGHRAGTYRNRMRVEPVH